MTAFVQQTQSGHIPAWNECCISGQDTRLKRKKLFWDEPFPQPQSYIFSALLIWGYAGYGGHPFNTIGNTRKEVGLWSQVPSSPPGLINKGHLTAFILEWKMSQRPQKLNITWFLWVLRWWQRREALRVLHCCEVCHSFIQLYFESFTNIANVSTQKMETTWIKCNLTSMLLWILILWIITLFLITSAYFSKELQLTHSVHKILNNLEVIQYFFIFIPWG